jgi:hypothetical protein
MAEIVQAETIIIAVFIVVKKLLFKKVGLCLVVYAPFSQNLIIDFIYFLPPDNFP